MEMSIRKTAEQLSFDFRNENDEYIISSILSGSNFRYIKNENNIIIRIDLEKNFRNCHSDDMKDFINWHKELKTIYVDNDHIIKGLENLYEFNIKSKYFLELSIGQNKIKKYNLLFEDNENLGIKLNLDYI